MFLFYLLQNFRLYKKVVHILTLTQVALEFHCQTLQPFPYYQCLLYIAKQDLRGLDFLMLSHS